ncbi:CMGC/CK2 protein kinase [Pochonia chlamydosporia 170]|uniref:EKC/KEOPS complex subunit BUD32 n=1 Tax=Pochonia chlamydosporia 170 TaxID=1380566 RepID=A0A179FPS8_METCM|nr:CMGC/CK2 protein kinase [Pochonia chlamydosporia 170]OAQ67230.1 CMGC/CK2 protein kinase [Pochonia chlamydosporia 170]
MPGRLEPLVTLPENGELDLDTGKGRNAVVFEADDVVGDIRYAIKVFRRTRNRIDREIQMLQHLRGGRNIVSYFETLNDDEGVPRALVLEAVDHTDFRQLFPQFGMGDIQYYASELIEAICFCHSHGVMHRDIRPHNIVINPQTKQLRLVGWGSAKFWDPGEDHSVRVSLFKPPELLVDYRKYDFSIDMWGFGSVLASLVFRKEPFFHGNSISDMLVKISKVLGTDELFDFLDKFEIELDEHILSQLEYQPRRPWSSFITPENESNVSDEVFDLLNRVLRYNPRERLSADEASFHQFFTMVTGNYVVIEQD